MAWRCPKCNAAIKVDADWCGQCYADLRPPPPPPPPKAPPLVAPAAAVGPAAEPAAPGEQLFAPYDTAGAASAPLWTDEEPAPPTGWPCTECGGLNDFELSACGQCGAPFGAALREPRTHLPGERGTRLAAALAIALVLTALVALLSRGGTPQPVDDVPAPVVVEDTTGG